MIDKLGIYSYWEHTPSRTKRRMLKHVKCNILERMIHKERYEVEYIDCLWTAGRTEKWGYDSTSPSVAGPNNSQQRGHSHTHNRRALTIRSGHDDTSVGLTMATKHVLLDRCAVSLCIMYHESTKPVNCVVIVMGRYTTCFLTWCLCLICALSILYC